MRISYPIIEVDDKRKIQIFPGPENREWATLLKGAIESAMQKRKTEPSMTDVAELAGVSQAAVSYVVNGLAEEKRIPEATRERIEAACEELGYRRNYLATAMATKETRVIGMLFANALGEFMNGIIKGAQDYLREHDRHVVLCTCDDDPAVEERDLEMLAHRHADGIICFPVTTAEPTAYWDRLLKEGPPLVFVDGLPREMSADCVRIDDFACGIDAAHHFHRDNVSQTVVLHMPNQDAASVKMRQEGFQAGLRDHGLPPATMVETSDLEQVKTLLMHPGEKVGVFAAVTGWLTGVLRPLIRQEGAIANAVALASIGRCPEADFVANSWWTAEQPETEMGRVAALHLLHHLGEKEAAPPSLVLPVNWHHNRR